MPIIDYKRAVAAQPNILHISLVYGQNLSDHIAEIVTSLLEELSTAGLKVTVIFPDFTKHQLLSKRSTLNKENCYEFSHYYNDRVINSEIVKIIEDGITKYILRPVSSQLTLEEATALYIEDYSEIENFPTLIPKIIYFNSAVIAAAIKFKDQFFSEVNMIYLHGWEGGLIAKTLKRHCKYQEITWLLGLYATLDKQVFSINLERSIISSLGSVEWFAEATSNLLKEAILAVDHLIYGSSGVAKQLLSYSGVAVAGLREMCERYANQGKITLIPNGITDQFDLKHLKQVLPELSLSDLINAKLQAKIKLSSLISMISPLPDQAIAANLDSLTTGNLINVLDPNQSLISFIINKLNAKDLLDIAAVISVAVKENIQFLMLITYCDTATKLAINNLLAKHSDLSTILIITGTTAVAMNKYLGLIRLASDFIFITSNQQCSDLITMKAQLNLGLVIAPKHEEIKAKIRPQVNGFTYATNQNAELSTQNIQQALTQAISFLKLLSKDPLKYEANLKARYEYGCRNYLWDSAEGSIKQYVHFLTLLLSRPPYDYVQHSIELSHETLLKVAPENLNIPDGLTLEMFKSRDNTNKTLFEIPGSANCFMWTHEGDLIMLVSTESSQQFLSELKHATVSRVLLGKLLYSINNVDLIGGWMLIKEHKVTNLQNLQSLCNELNILQANDQLWLRYIEDHGKLKDHKYIFEKLNGGKSLAQILQEQKLSLVDKLMISIAVFTAVQSLHRQGIIHADLTPNNIMLLNNKQQQSDLMIKLTDFAKSKFSTANQPLVGLKAWSQVPAPEVQKFLAGVKTDVYSLGIVLANIFAEEFNLKQPKTFNVPTVMQFMNSLDPLFAALGTVVYDQKGNQLFNSDIVDLYAGTARLVLQQIQDLICQMLSSNYSERPDLTECLTVMQKLLLQINHANMNDQIFTADLYEFCTKFGFDLNDLTRPNNYGANALNYACEHGWIEVVRQILSMPNFTFSTSGAGNNSALHYAVRQGSFRLIKLLLTHKADPTLLNADGLDPLRLLEQQQLSNNHKQQLRGLFKLYSLVTEHGFDFADLNKPNQHGDLPLTWILQYQSTLDELLALCRILLENGAYVNIKDLKGKTALYYSLQHQDHQVLELLINYGADLSNLLATEPGIVAATSHHDLLMLYAWCKKYQVPSLAVGARNIDGHSAITACVVNRDLMGLELFTKFYTKNNPELTLKNILNERSIEGYTPLHLAVKNQDMAIIKFLLAKEVDLYLPTLSGENLLDLAISPEIRQLILEKLSAMTQDLASFANHNIFLIAAYDRKAFNQIFAVTILHPEWLVNSGDFLKYVLNNISNTAELFEIVGMGFDISVVLKQIDSLQISEEIKSTLILIDFLSANQFKVALISINQANDSKYTPLTMAMNLPPTKAKIITNLLVHAGADLNQIDGFGNTPLHAAVASQNLSMVKECLKLGSNMLLLNTKGKTAYDLAVISGDQSIIATLEYFIKYQTVDSEIKEQIFSEPIKDKKHPVIKPVVLFSGLQRKHNHDAEFKFKDNDSNPNKTGFTS